MIGWSIAIVYTVGFVIAARLIASALANDGDTDTEDIIMSRVLGFLCGFAWPIIAFGALVTGRLPKTDQQLRTEHAAQQQRIAELEKELGIGSKS